MVRQRPFAAIIDSSKNSCEEHLLGRPDAMQGTDPAARRLFTRRVLEDLRAFQRMHDEDLFEAGVRRIGAEQEMFLVDRHGRPALLSPEILETLDDPHFTTELGRFNLEANLDPQVFDARCLGRLEGQLRALVDQARRAARAQGGEVFLTGILPTLDKADLALTNMTPVPRYFALNEAMMAERGHEFTLRIEGPDQLVISHDNVLLEACNTSFQVHFQVAAAEFARLYNLAQAVTAPVLAAATNSPLLFGRRLWRETRIALFEQSIDTRVPTSDLRQQSPRVTFGTQWVRESAVEIFQRDLSRFPVVLVAGIEEKPLAMLDRGETPRLDALRLHNGTVYRWNRPCYGISNGKPHLRIENRALPAGPTIVDEMANTAFWLGLMSGLSKRWPDVSTVMPFHWARENFVAAARQGLGAAMNWPERGEVPAPVLILEELLPAAREGLRGASIAREDIDRYLDVIEERVRSSRTGSQWLVDSTAALAELPQAERLATVVLAGVRRQIDDQPVHTWSLAAADEAEATTRYHHQLVAHLMSTDLFTVGEEDVVDLVASVMKWRHIRHVPVEDQEHRLVGLVTYRTLMRVLSDSARRDDELALPVRDVMQREVITVTPDCLTLEAMRLMRRHRVGCLPVIDRDGRLVGIITEHDLIELARPLLERYLEARDDPEPPAPARGTRK
jgi:CBS domain-containing protein